MADDPIQLFIAAPIAPTECPRTLQELADLMARSIIPNPDAGDHFADTKQGIIIGGGEPVGDQGPWLPEGQTELWFYDGDLARYFPAGQVASIVGMGLYQNNPGPNWLLCNGTTIGQAQQSRLFRAIGHSFANPDKALPDNGRTNAATGADAVALQAAGQFRLPNMIGACLVGAGGERLWIEEAAQKIGAAVVGDRMGQAAQQLQANHLFLIPGYGLVCEYDSAATHAGQPRIYGGVHFNDAMTSLPGSDLNPAPTVDGSYLNMQSPQNVVNFYIHI